MVSKTPPPVLLEVNWKSGSGGGAWAGLCSGSSPSPTASEAISRPKKSFFGRGFGGGGRGRRAGAACPIFREIGALLLEEKNKWVCFSDVSHLFRGLRADFRVFRAGLGVFEQSFGVSSRF